MSGALSESLAHVLILLTNLNPSGGSSTPQFLFFLHSLTNPTQADSGTKIWRASKRQLERFDFRSRRRRQNFLDPSVSHDLMRQESAAFVLKPGNVLVIQIRSVWNLTLKAARKKNDNAAPYADCSFLHFLQRISRGYRQEYDNLDTSSRPSTAIRTSHRPLTIS